MGTGSSSCCNSFGLAGLEVPSINSQGRPGLFGTQPGRSRLVCPREILGDEIQCGARAPMDSISLPGLEGWEVQKVSLSTTEVQAGVNCGFTTPETRTAKFCFPQISQQQHFTLPLWPNAAEGRENKEGREWMLLHKCFHRPDYCFLGKETPFIKSVMNWHLISRGNKRKVLVKGEICLSTYKNCFPLHA